MVVRHVLVKTKSMIVRLLSEIYIKSNMQYGSIIVFVELCV